MKKLVLIAAWLSLGAMKPTRLEDLSTESLQKIDYQKRTVISFVQPGCGPCKTQLMALKCLKDKLPNVDVYAVQSTGEPGELARSLRSLHLNFPVLKGTRRYLESFGAEASPTPMTAIVAKGGKVTDRILGALPCQYWVEQVTKQ